MYPARREQEQHCQLRSLLQAIKCLVFSYIFSFWKQEHVFLVLSLLLYRNASFIPYGNEEKLPKHT